MPYPFVAAARPVFRSLGLACPRCAAPLDRPPASGTQSCPRCRGGFEAVAFDPLPLPVPPPRPLSETDSTPCAVHARYTAEASCERCGVFVCALCRIETDARALCPACFDRLRDEDALPSLRHRFEDFQARASVLALLSLLMCYLGFALGPAAVYYAVRAWRQQAGGAPGGSKTGLVLAILVGCAAFLINLAMFWGLLARQLSR